MPALMKTVGLAKTYWIPDSRRFFKKRRIDAVKSVSIQVEQGKTLGIVGESGSGKSTLARLLLGLERPNQGQVFYQKESLAHMRGDDLKIFRRRVQIVFQDPLSSLNPRMRVRDILLEPFRIHGMQAEFKRSGRSARKPALLVEELLGKVGLAATHAARFPHQLSGGERQRIAIARALALKPQVVICDEAVSSLDVLVQAQILNLLLKLQREEGLAYIFISHDLKVVRHMSDTVVVMKDGEIIEQGLCAEVLSKPQQTYTRALLNASQIKF